MRQVVQDISNGRTAVRAMPDPVAQPSQILVGTVASLVSAGTERYVVDLARKSLLGKARERPDHVRRVLQKVRQEGLFETLTQVRAKLDEPMPLGYSAAGIVLECGRGVQEFRPGDRVACAGPHAGIVSVSRRLCARIPEGVTFEQAAYTSVAAIGMEGVRLSKTTLGERVLVIGLGLIGQICVCLLKAQGCRVFGTDVDSKRLELAQEMGADAVGTNSPRAELMAFSDQYGVDAVVITAATASNEPIELAADACRPKGRIVLVGVVGLSLPRAPFFAKELEFTVSSSLGPGRSDPQYEEKGIDYPIGHARWTAQRNMAAVLETMAAGKLPVEKLTTHRFPIEEAEQAYELITRGNEPHLGIIIQYPPAPAGRERRVDFRTSIPVAGKIGVSVIGAGNYARLVMLPALDKRGSIRWRALCSAKGMNAEATGQRMGFAFATTDAAQIWDDDATKAVFIATRHDLHANLVVSALKAGKHVFVEKPLCIHPNELDEVDGIVRELGDKCPLLMVGLNRRFAPATARIRQAFAGIAPLSVSYRFSPGSIPASAWPQDEDVGGGRIIGEACHAIDTCTAITGSVPVRVFAESVGGVKGAETSDDSVFITLRHENGSISNISYQARGDRAFPPERIEVFGGGRVGVIDAWNRVEVWTGGRCQERRGGKDKGHAAGFRAFLEAARNGGAWPIPWEHIYWVTWASMAAVQSLREGVPQVPGGE